MKRLAPLLLCACGSTDWMDHPSSENARDITSLTWVAVLVLTAITLVVWVILAYLVARRRRGTFAEHMPYTTKTGMAWIYTWASRSRASCSPSASSRASS